MLDYEADCNKSVRELDLSLSIICCVYTFHNQIYRGITRHNRSRSLSDDLQKCIAPLSLRDFSLTFCVCVCVCISDDRLE